MEATPLPDKLRNLLCALFCPSNSLLAREPNRAKPIRGHRPIALPIPRGLKLRPLVELVTIVPDDQRSGRDACALVVAGNDVDQDIGSVSGLLGCDDFLSLDLHPAIWE